MNQNKKYLVIPGYVTSQYDGDRHWVSALRLMHLYGVDPRLCVVQYREFPGRIHDTSLICLEPRHDGDYRLPNA
jgi:hypothetical protein